jgi:hypothetical protein
MDGPDAANAARSAGPMPHGMKIAYSKYQLAAKVQLFFHVTLPHVK